MRTYDFPFSIADVVGPSVLGLTIRRLPYDGGKMDVDCPFCYISSGHKKGKLNVTPLRNAFRCNYCGEEGGMLLLYSLVQGVDTKVAYREIVELLGVGKGDKKANYQASSTGQSNKTNTVEAVRADSFILHQTYTMLLNSLSLAAPHMTNLIERGLSKSAIEAFGYKSVPAFGQKELCEKLVATGCVLEGVPGFFKDEDGRWMIKLKAPGILVPIRSVSGHISGMQVRLNKPFNGKKYIWLSSGGLPGGTGSGSPIHFVGNPAANLFFITEGALKGDIAHNLSRYCFTNQQSFICVPGVNAISKLDAVLAELKNTGGNFKLIEAFDSNKRSNPHVAKALEKLNEKVASHGITMNSVTWNEKTLNGIDDYYKWRYQRKEDTMYSFSTSDEVAAV